MSNVVIAIPLFMLMIIVALLPLLIGVYVYRDAKRRGMNAALWTLIAILAPSLIGFIIYLLVRGNYSNLKCPRCAATVTEQYVVCPKCGAKLKPSCPNCSAPVEPDWTVCPKCAQPLPTVQEDIVTPVQPKDKTLWKILAAIIIVPVVSLQPLVEVPPAYGKSPSMNIMLIRNFPKAPRSMCGIGWEKLTPEPTMYTRSDIPTDSIQIVKPQTITI